MLHIHYSNRLERLFHQLNQIQSKPNTAIESSILEKVLEPSRILVQSQGMARWLSIQMAQAQGIAANIQYPYPASYLWSVLTQQIHGLPERSSFDKNLLQWRILKLLPKLIESPEFEPIRQYLQDDLGEQAQGMKAYQLAGKVADIFDQYLVYRPDWIQQWEQSIPAEVQSAWHMALPTQYEGVDSQPLSNSDWQAKLWRELVQAIVLTDSSETSQKALPESQVKEWHRARLVQEFLTLAKQGKLKTELFPDTLHVFGVSVLPPVYLQLFQVMAQTSDIHLYVMNPSLGYWGDLVTPNQLARLRKRWQAQGKTDVSDTYESGNDLLVSMGQQGQEYQVLLQDLLENSEAMEYDVFDETDTHNKIDDRANLLSLIQSDILQLENRYLRGGKTPLTPEQINIRVHDCHSPMREVEVLHDQLLHCFEQNPTLKPHDIVVMVPDVDRYSPYIHSVFGTRQGDQYIPFSVADRHGRQEHPILEAFFQLLSLAGSDFTLPDALSLLNVKALQARFEFEDIAKLTQWITGANIRWGLDSKQRQSAGVDTAANTWRFGIQRMLMGYLYGDLDETLYFDGDPVSPLTMVEGKLANDVGKLAELINALASLDNLANKKTIEDWKDTIFTVLEQFFVAEGDDEALLQIIRDVVTRLAQDMQQAQFDDVLHFSVVQDYLERHVGEMSQGQHFLSGQVSFCTLMPMRAIPFSVVAIMGLNDSDYPRRQPRLGFDLMANHHRKGDRSRREDDRYLFLEALLSARTHLHISYVGRSIRDNAEKQPSVLVSELLDYASASFCIEGQDQTSILDFLVIHHPLQPFNPAYYHEQALAMQSFNHQWLAPALELTQDAEEIPSTQDLFSVTEEDTKSFIRFYQSLGLSIFKEESSLKGESSPKNQHTICTANQLSLDELKQFFSHPAKTLLRQSMGIDLYQQSQNHEKTEAYQVNHLQNYYFVEQAVEHVLAEKTVEFDDQHDFDFDHYISRYIDQLVAQGSLPYSGFGELSQKALKTQIRQFVTPILAANYQPEEDIELNLTLTPSAIALGDDASIQFVDDNQNPASIQLTGWVKHHFDQGLVMSSYSNVFGRALMNIWIEHLAQCAQASTPEKRTHYYARDQKLVFKALSQESAITILNQLVGLYAIAQHYWLPIFPKSGWAYVSAGQDEKTATQAERKALDQLLGHDYLNGEFDSWYDYLYRDQPISIDALFCQLHTQIFLPLYQHMEQDEAGMEVEL